MAGEPRQLVCVGGWGCVVGGGGVWGSRGRGGPLAHPRQSLGGGCPPAVGGAPRWRAGGNHAASPPPLPTTHTPRCAPPSLPPPAARQGRGARLGSPRPHCLRHSLLTMGTFSISHGHTLLTASCCNIGVARLYGHSWRFARRGRLQREGGTGWGRPAEPAWGGGDGRTCRGGKCKAAGRVRATRGNGASGGREGRSSHPIDGMAGGHPPRAQGRTRGAHSK